MSKNKNFSDTSANRYSVALYELAKESNELNEIEKNCLSFINLISNNEEIKSFIKNPTIKKEELITIISKISNNYNLNALFKKFLCFLITKRRFFYVNKILNDFIETCSKKRGEVNAKLTSARELSESEISSIKDELTKNFNSKIRLNYKHDSSLIGGLIVQVGSTMVDTSIKNKLNKLQNIMVEA